MKKKCYDGSKFIEPCCDRKTNRACHFKKGIDFEKMREEYKEYKDIESHYGLQAISNIYITKLIRNLRQNWLHKYYRPECWKCDNNGINHEGHIQNMNTYIQRQTRKQGSRSIRRTKRTPSIRTPSIRTPSISKLYGYKGGQRFRQRSGRHTRRKTRRF